MCGLEPRTNFVFSFKKSTKTSADWIQVRIGFENMRYIYDGESNKNLKYLKTLNITIKFNGNI